MEIIDVASELLDIEAAAKRLKISVKTLRRMCKREPPDIAFVYYAQKYLFTEEDLDAYIASKRVEPGVSAPPVADTDE